MATVSTGDVIQAAHQNAIVNALKGTTGENLTVFMKGVDIVSANALVLGTDGNYWHITGTTAITSISSLPAGTVIKLEFDGALLLTHNATTLILQGATSYTTAAGDVFEFTSEGSGNWRETGRGLSASTTTIASTFGATPSLTFSTTNGAGTGTGFIRRNATIALFDTTAARAVAFGDVGTTGGVNFASPRDHGHAFALGATVVASTNNGLTVASTNGNLGWTAVAPATHTTPAMTATVAGHVPTPPNNTTTFLRGDGTFAAPSGGTTVVITKYEDAVQFSTTSTSYDAGSTITNMTIAVTTASAGNNVHFSMFGQVQMGTSSNVALQIYNSTDAAALVEGGFATLSNGSNAAASLQHWGTLVASAKTIIGRMYSAGGTCYIGGALAGMTGNKGLVAVEYR